MIFTETGIAGAHIIDLERHEDHRGFFARGFCAKEFSEHGLPPTIAQINISFNHEKGTVRGLHYQVPPAPEAKFIRCVHGAIFDVMVDMRPSSPTYLRWVGVELTAGSGRAVFVPEMCAHGYQALTEGATVLYSVSEFYRPEYERGVRPDDPALGIRWPLPIGELSAKERSWPLFKADRDERERAG